MKAHPTDRVSLGFGLVFLAVAAWWLVAQLLDLAPPTAGWFLAVALIVFGVLGLLGALRSGRTPGAPADHAEPAAGPTTDPTTGAPAGSTGGT